MLVFILGGLRLQCKVVLKSTSWLYWFCWLDHRVEPRLLVWGVAKRMDRFGRIGGGILNVGRSGDSCRIPRDEK